LVFVFLRRRANTAAAAMPNSSVIGGSGTSVPLVVLVVVWPQCLWHS